MTLIRRVNDWLIRYPLSFAVIVIAIAALALAGTALVQGARLDRVENQQCLDARYKFAQTSYIDALTTRDPEQVAAAEAEFHARSIDLVLNAGGHHVACAIDLSTIPGG